MSAVDSNDDEVLSCKHGFDSFAMSMDLDDINLERSFNPDDSAASVAAQSFTKSFLVDFDESSLHSNVDDVGFNNLHNGSQHSTHIEPPVHTMVPNFIAGARSEPVVESKGSEAVQGKEPGQTPSGASVSTPHPQTEEQSKQDKSEGVRTRLSSGAMKRRVSYEDFDGMHVSAEIGALGVCPCL